MQEKTVAGSKQASKLGLIINKNKTEVMRSSTDRTPVTLDGTILKEVEKLTYLGSTVAMNAECPEADPEGGEGGSTPGQIVNP